MTGAPEALQALLLLLLLASSGCHARGGFSTAAAALTAGEQERQVLLAFAGNITNWPEVQAARQLAGWAPCTPAACMPVCLWGGVSCDAFGSADGTHVTSLELSCSAPCAAPMRGALAPGLERLPFLQTLDLSWNALGGGLPREWGADGAFPSLQVLELQHNVLSGPVPEEWAWGGGFQRIVDFQLGSNQLTGPFPSVAVTNASFTQMQSFNIANNRFSGTLPDSWNGLVTLVRAQIQNNLFSGTIPPNWGKQGYLLPNGTVNNTDVLQTLYMHGNRLTGSLPAAFGSPGAFTALRELTLSDNPLSGPLPAAWGDRSQALPALQLLNLSNAGLTGALPEWGTGLQALRSLVLTDNELTGTIPASWLQLPSLRDVVVSPGNPGLCTAAPLGAQFTLCSSADMLCLTPLPADDDACPGGSGGGGGFPAAAVAVPVAVVGAAVLAAAGFLLWRRRRRRAAAGGAAEDKADAADATNAGPLQSESVKFWPGQDSPLPGATGPTGTPLSASLSTVAASVGTLTAAPGAAAEADALWVRSQSLPAEAGRPPPVPGELAPVPAMAPLGSYSMHAHHPLLPAAASAPPGFWMPRAGSTTSSSTEASAAATGAAVAAAAAAAASGRGVGCGPLPWMPPLGHPAWDSAALAAAAAAAAATIAAARGSYTWSPSPLPASAQHSWGARAAASMTAPEAPLAARASTGGAASARSLPWLPPQPRRSWPPDLLAAGSLEPRGSSSQADERSSLGRGSPDPADLDLLLSDWEIDPDSVTIARRPDGTPWRLGSGGFGTVFKAFRNGVTPVAVKVLGAVTTDARAVMSNKEFVQEIKLLRACRDTNILQFQGCCFKDGETLLVTEYCEGGNLAHNLRARTVGWYRRGKKIALDVARAVVYLHSRRIVHLDIKSANVLLTRDGTAKVGDVGMAKIMAGDYVSGVVGTLAWSAPELLLGDRCTEKADIYSLGVVLWEIATGELPSRGQMRELMVPEDCPQELASLINRCLASDPAVRPSAVEVVELLQKAPAVPGRGVVPRLPPAGPPPPAGRRSVDGDRPPPRPGPPAGTPAGAGGVPSAPSGAGSLGCAGGTTPSDAASVAGWAPVGAGSSGGLPGGTAAAVAATDEAADPAAVVLTRQPSGGPASMGTLSPFASALQQQGRQPSVNSSGTASPQHLSTGSRGRPRPAPAAPGEAQAPASADAEHPSPVRLSAEAPPDGLASRAAQQAQQTAQQAHQQPLPPLRPQELPQPLPEQPQLELGVQPPALHPRRAALVPSLEHPSQQQQQQQQQHGLPPDQAAPPPGLQASREQPQG